MEHSMHTVLLKDRGLHTETLFNMATDNVIYAAVGGRGGSTDSSGVLRRRDYVNVTLNLMHLILTRCEGKER